MEQAIIYVLTCKDTGLQYVGQTIFALDKRWRQHVNDSRNKDAKGMRLFYLQSAIAKYGADAFDREVIATCTRQDADEEESKYIEQLQTVAPKGYNLTSGGQGYNKRHVNPEGSAGYLRKTSGLPLYITKTKKVDWYMVAVPGTPKKYFSDKERAVEHRSRCLANSNIVVGKKAYQKYDLPVYIRMKTYPSYYRVDVPKTKGRKFKCIEDAVEYRDRMMLTAGQPL